MAMFNIRKEHNMGNFLVGIIMGIILCTVGASGMAKWIDKGVGVVKHEAQQLK